MMMWQARPLSPNAKEAKYQEMRSLTADRFILRKGAVVFSVSALAVSMTFLGVSAAGWMGYIATKSVECQPFAYTVDRTTGIIDHPVSFNDGTMAKTMPEATDRYYLKRYVQACFGYVPAMYAYNDRLCKLMSTPSEQVRIERRKGDSDAPVSRLKRDGQIDIESFKTSPRAVGADNTRSYFVQFVGVETKGQENGHSTINRAFYSGVIDFQWHPELPMKPADRDDNAGGFQVLANGISPDTGPAR